MPDNTPAFPPPPEVCQRCRGKGVCSSLGQSYRCLRCDGTGRITVLLELGWNEVTGPEFKSNAQNLELRGPISSRGDDRG